MVIATTCAVVMMAIYLNPQINVPVSSPQYYSTQIGETRNITLEDGSHIYINTNSVVEQVYSKQERSIRLLSGEAIFDVAHDEKRPFKVYTKDGIVRAVGTRFAVRVMSTGISVVVTEGRVSLEKRENANVDVEGVEESVPQKNIPLILNRGDAAEILNANPVLGNAVQNLAPIKQYAANESVVEQLSWSQGQLVFQGKSLQYVVDEVSRYTPVKIKIMNEELMVEKITGIFPIGDVELMLDGIEVALGAKAEWIHNGLVHISKE